MLCSCCRQEVDDKTPDVEDVDQAYYPLEISRDVIVFLVFRDAEGYSQAEFYKDEEEFDPEGNAEDAVLAEVDAKTLVLGADEDGGDDVAGAVRFVSILCILACGL